MITQPKITIIVPMYNVETYIQTTLESIEVQTLPEIEVILVDDGSKDSSAAIAQTFVDKYPDRFRLYHKENGGLGDARNFGLRMATGKYLLFLDGDDALTREACEILYDRIEKAGCDILLFGARWIVGGVEKGTVTYLDKWLKMKETNLRKKEEMVMGFPVATSKLYRTSMLLQNQILFEPRIIGEDVLYSIQTYHFSSNIQSIPEHLYLRTERGEPTNLSITQQASYRAIKDRIQVIQKGKKLCNDFQLKRCEKDLIHTQINHIEKMLCKVQGIDYQEGMKAYQEVIQEIGLLHVLRHKYRNYKKGIIQEVKTRLIKR